MLGWIGNDAILLFANDVLTAESEGQSQRKLDIWQENTQGSGSLISI